MVSPRERRHLPWIPPGPEKTGCGLAGYAGLAGPRTDCRLPAGHQTVGLADLADLADPVGLAGPPGSVDLADLVDPGSAGSAGPVDLGCSDLVALVILAAPVALAVLADLVVGPADLEIVGSAVL